LFRDVWSNFELRSDRRFHFFLSDSGIAFHFAPTSDWLRHSYLSCTRASVHDDSFCFGVCWNCRKRYRRFTAKQRNRIRYHAGSAPGLLLLEEVQTSRFMSVPLSDCQFAGFSRWNGFHANGIASPYRERVRVSFRLQKPLTSILSPCGRGRREGPAP